VGRFLVWGAGGHGKVVADLVRAAGFTVAGFIDGNTALFGRQVEPGGGCIVMTEEEFARQLLVPAALRGVADAVALAIGANQVRIGRLHQAAGAGALPLPPLRHPSATVSPSAVLGDATVVFAGAVINADARIGAAVIVNSAAVIEHDCRVGDGAHISPGAVLAGGVNVGARAWVGAGAIVIQGVSIGADAVVGAGAVVIRDVSGGARVAGVPAVPLRSTAGR
jgi:UDP-perosamine 4-acetyltransferase